MPQDAVSVAPPVPLAGSESWAEQARVQERAARTQRRWVAMLMLAPLVVGLTVFALYPLAYLLALSVTDSTLGQPLREWVGLDNYDWALFGAGFTGTLVRTALFAIPVSLIQLALGLGVALLLHEAVRSGRIVRALFLLPLMTPPVMVGIAWKLILAPGGGWLNGLLQHWGLIVEPISFLGSQDFAFPAVMLADTWQWTPFVAILCYAALQSLPKDVYEAAALDGAYAGTIFRTIVLPMLAPALVAIFLLRMIIAFKTFDLVYILTFGGPGNATNLSSFAIWKTSLREFDVGLGAAQTVIFGVLVGLLTLPVTWAYRRAEAHTG